MRKVSATEASKAFGQLVDDVQSESVTIERNGRPIAAVSYTHLTLPTIQL